MILRVKVVANDKLFIYNPFINSTNGINKMTKTQLIAAIKNSGKVENSDAAMHADAILNGDYTLPELFANAGAFYGYNGHAHEDALMDTM